MKVLRNAVLFTVLVIFSIGLALLVFLKTFDLNKFLPQITQAASQALGRPVAIGQADLNLSLHGVSLDVRDITVADDLKFSSQPFARIARAQMTLDLLPLIIQRTIAVTQIILDSPQVAVIRSKEGAVNAQTIGAGTPAQSVGPASDPVQPKPAPAAARPVALPVLSVSKIVVSHGAFTFKDDNPAFPVDFQVGDINIQVNDFSLTDPFRFVLDASICSAANNTHAEGKARIDAAKSAAMISDMAVKINLGQVEGSRIKALSLTLSSMPDLEQIQGQMVISISSLGVSAAGLTALSAHAALSDGQVAVDLLLSPFSKITAQADIGLKDIVLKGFSFVLASGQVSASAELKDYLKAQKFNGRMQASGVKVEELLDPKILPVEWRGKISVTFNAQGAGFAPEALYQDLTGEGELSLQDGIIGKMNFVKMALGNTFKAIPGLADALDSLLSGALKDKLGGDTTVIDQAWAKCSIAKGVLSIDEALVATKVFDLTATGTVDYQLKTGIQTLLRLSKDLSASIVDDIKELAYVQDADQRVAIPAMITGTIPELKYVPQVDLKKVATNAIVEEGSKQLQKVIEKNPVVGDILNAILGGGSAPLENAAPAPENTAPPQENSQQPSREQAPVEDKTEKTKALINGVLNSILR